MDVKILYRHPRAENRKLPPKVLELWDEKEKTNLPFVAQNVNGNWIYTVPLRYAQRLLANQPDRFYLLEPNELTVKTRGEKDFSFQYVTVKARPDLMAKFAKQESDAGAEAEAKANQEAEAKAAAKQKAKEKAEADAEAERKAKADQEALDALQNADLPEAGDARPPEL